MFELTELVQLVSFSIPIVALLIYASWYDLEHRKVQYWVISLVLVIGLLYMFLFANIIETVAVLIFISFIFGTATFFSFGVGDFLILLGLGCFMGNIDYLYLFLFIFLFFWLLTTIGFVWTKVKKEGYRLRDKKLYINEFPFVFVIVISYVSWVVMVVVEWW